MCSEENAKKIVSRLQGVLDALKNQNSGADVHHVGNLRNTCILLISQIEDDPYGIPEEQAIQIMINCEVKLYDFYRKKYPSRR